MCAHLVVEKPAGYVAFLTGTMFEYDLLCGDCADSPDPAGGLVAVCAGCVARADEWASMAGWRGEPEVRHLDRDLLGTWSTRDCSAVPLSAKSLAPLPGGWLVLSEDGLVEIPDDGPLGEAEPLAEAEPEEDGPRHKHEAALHVSLDGRFAAVVIDYGRHGQLRDRRTGQLVRRLDRGDYHPDVQVFSATFAVVDGATVLIASSDWNRLDAFDPETGRCLTERPTDDANAESYLDYFHAGLLLSPSGRLLCDDGWLWHPVAAPAIVDLTAWLGGDPHAAERPRFLGERWGDWGEPIAWIDEDTIAVQRIGPDELAMIDGIMIHSAATGERMGVFAGPAGPMWGHDGLLYVNATEGLEVWDPALGARIGLLRGFHPIGHNPMTGAFAELADGRLRTWTRSSEKPGRLHPNG